MKLKDLFTKVINKRNKQIILNPKKKLIKSIGYDDVDDILDIKLENKIKCMLHK